MFLCYISSNFYLSYYLKSQFGIVCSIEHFFEFFVSSFFTSMHLHDYTKLFRHSYFVITKYITMVAAQASGNCCGIFSMHYHGTVCFVK
jgi:hypothetical protein